MSNPNKQVTPCDYSCGGFIPPPKPPSEDSDECVELRNQKPFPPRKPPTKKATKDDAASLDGSVNLLMEESSTEDPEMIHLDYERDEVEEIDEAGEALAQPSPTIQADTSNKENEFPNLSNTDKNKRWHPVFTFIQNDA
jgi:hypothetical protein